eukprot:51312-Eustigmatos_ZCMA.PRE.1
MTTNVWTYVICADMLCRPYVVNDMYVSKRTRVSTLILTSRAMALAAAPDPANARHKWYPVDG